MRIFLTGGTGFIGSHFLAELPRLRHDVTALRRPDSNLCVKIENEPRWLEKQMDKLDVSDLGGHEVLVHLASVGVSPKKATWEELIYWNVVVLMRLLEISRAAGVRRIVIAGSFAEYGLASERYEFIPIDAPLQPTSAYAASKAAGFIAASAFAIENQMEFCYLRIFSVFGEGQYEGNFWPALHEAAVRGKDFPMTAGEQIRDYIPVRDVAKAILFASEKEDISPGSPSVLNVGSGNPITMREFAEKYWKEWNATGQLQIGALPYRANESKRFVPEINGLIKSTFLSKTTK
jgi:nucleoside-diphosphate-sugar epimerase